MLLKTSVLAGAHAYAWNPTTQEAEIRRIMVPSQVPGQRVCETISKKTITKKGSLSGSRCRPWIQTLVQQKKKKKKKTRVLFTLSEDISEWKGE
jgi:hypothetical protein